MIASAMLMAAVHGWPLDRAGQDDRSAAARLAAYINEERNASGLPSLPISPALARVARAHVRDLVDHRPDVGNDAQGRRCTMHSWSSAGSWRPVCFTSDNARASSMWSKPREITRGAYRGDGFEIAYRMPGGVDADSAIDGWLRSPVHASVIIEQGVWRDARWRAMGVALYGDYAVAWFGKDPDFAARDAR